ncbi:MAG: hypothetical protein HY289_08365, partial [Planctomycetes bacterium]|nr:hypothetical protein [Planctomycetota bacterium]
MTLPRNLLLLVSVFPFLLPGPARADAPVKVRLLRVQQVGATTYFHVRFDAPADLLDAAIRPGPYAEAERRALALTPMLVPQDGKTSAVYQRLDLEHFRPNVQFRDRAEIPPIDGLEFAGKLDGAGKAKFVLLYPTTTKEKAPPGIQDKELAKLLRPTRWREVPIEMDFAKSDALPAKANLEKLWAHAQASRFAVLEAQAPQTGFFGFACAATGRKYGVPDPALEGERLTADEHVHRKMFDLTTGALAITESLALKR